MDSFYWVVRLSATNKGCLTMNFLYFYTKVRQSPSVLPPSPPKNSEKPLCLHKIKWKVSRVLTLTFWNINVHFQVLNKPQLSILKQKYCQVLGFNPLSCKYQGRQSSRLPGTLGLILGV